MCGTAAAQMAREAARTGSWDLMLGGEPQRHG
jgi:hypothetical protein